MPNTSKCLYVLMTYHVAGKIFLFAKTQIFRLFGNMTSKQDWQKVKLLLESVSKVAPVYLMHTPIGKRLLQIACSIEANID